MTNTKPNPIFRLMPSLTDIAFVMPVIFLFSRMKGVRALLGDGDTGWHIRIGEWILAHHRVPTTDMFSFTRPGEPFFAWEWLWDLGAAMIHARFGLGGVVLASMFVLCLTFALLYRLVSRRCGNGVVALLVTVLAAAGSTIHWLARPHLLTWLFIVIFMSLLERVREGRTRLLWWLPVLTVLWTNLHGGFLAGIIILGAYGSGELVRALIETNWKDRMNAIRASLPYFATAAASMAASLLNPYFYHLHQHMWEYLHDPYQITNIVEFQSVNFRHVTAEFYEVMLVLGLGSIAWFGMRKNFRDAVLIAGWAEMSLVMVRNMPVFMIVTAAAAAAVVVEWIEALDKAPVAGWLKSFADFFRNAWEDMAPFERIGRAHVVGLLVLAVIGLGMSSPTAGTLLKPEYDPKAYPSGALALLQDPSERIFTHDEWGDYLLYQLSPKGVKVYVDGRSDFYGHDFCEEYITVMQVKYDWEQTLAKYRVNTVLLPPSAALASTLKESSHWRVVYDDGAAIVFRLRLAPPEVQVSTSGSGGGGRDLPITRDEVKKGARTL